MGRFANPNRRVVVDDELRALLSDELAAQLEQIEALQQTAAKAREALAEANDKLKQAEANDLAAEVEAVKSGGKAPAPKTPKAREAVENAERHVQAVGIALRQAQESFREALEAERAALVAPARERTDAAIAAVMGAFERFADTLDAETRALELAYSVEGSRDLASGLRRQPPQEVTLAVAKLREALVDNYSEGEQVRRERADKPQVDPGDDAEVTEDGKVRPRKVRAEVVW
jgi:hypothetical protein